MVDERGAIRPFSDLQTDRLAWSRDGHLYGTGLDDRTLIALDGTTGAEDWALPVDGSITAIATSDEGVAWMADIDTGMGSLVYVDGSTYAIGATLALPSARGALDVQGRHDPRDVGMGRGPHLRGRPSLSTIVGS